MIVIRVELWPYGQSSLKKELGVQVIANDGTGSADVGNYTTQLFKPECIIDDVTLDPKYANQIGATKRVVDYPRNSKYYNIWDLVLRSLLANRGKKNKKTIKRWLCDQRSEPNRSER